jgi:hypothetical protein
LERYRLQIAGDYRYRYRLQIQMVEDMGRLAALQMKERLKVVIG